MDSNQLELLPSKDPLKSPPRDIDVTQLSQLVLKGLFAKGSAIFATKIYALNAHAKDAKSIVDAWQKTPQWDALHKVSGKEKLIDQKNGSWLYVAIKCHDLEKAEELINAGANVNQATNEGMTPLHIAAWNGDLAAVEMLIKKGANVNKVDNDGSTPLLIAAQQDHFEAIEMLVKSGADVHKADKDGTTPLFMAAQDGHLAAVEMLIKKGAKVNKADNDGTTPLFIAAQNGHFAAVEILIKNGADVNQTTNGATPLYIAAQQGHLGVVHELLKTQGILLDSHIDASYKILYEKAKSKGCEQAFDKMLGIDLNKMKAPEILSGFTPLHAAIFFGHPEIVKELVQNGADTNKKLASKITPLELACLMGNEAIILTLLEKKTEKLNADDAAQEFLATIEIIKNHPIEQRAYVDRMMPQIINWSLKIGLDSQKIIDTLYKFTPEYFEEYLNKMIAPLNDLNDETKVNGFIKLLPNDKKDVFRKIYQTYKSVYTSPPAENAENPNQKRKRK